MTDSSSRPINLHGFPQAILHMDADAFFTSVEQALNPELRGRPVVTGVERGIIACASYEAKERGIVRGLPLHEAKSLCPELVILPDDYETYSLFSCRMFDVLRRFTPVVEEYSIDEAFADLTGLCSLHRCSYEQIARQVQETIRSELGISVSVGVSLSRTLAKLCSKFRKPRGITAVQGRHLHLLLERTAIDKVWGIGPNGAALLRKFGVATAYDFIQRPEAWVRGLLHKPGLETWFELQGHPIHPVQTTGKQRYGSIMKSHTFSPPTSDRELLYAELVRNASDALDRLRRLKLQTRRVAAGLRLEDFQHAGGEMVLPHPTQDDFELLPALRHVFDQVFDPAIRYRATLVVFGDIEPAQEEPPDLFTDQARRQAHASLVRQMDGLNRRYGKGTVVPGSLLDLARKPPDRRDARPERFGTPFPGETAKRRMAIPRMTTIRI